MTVTSRAWLGLLQLATALLLALLIPARTLAYPKAWLFVALFIGCSALITVYLQRHDLALLQRRLAAGPTAETRTLQKIIQAVAGLAFLGIFITAGLDHRHGWSHVPLALELLGAVLVAAGFYVVFRTFRANTFTSAAIETAESQQVISSGPYALVRHPMYAGALMLLVGSALMLGSYYALAGVLVLAVVIVARLLDEERYLARELPGYDAYRGTVRHRLIPGLW